MATAETVDLGPPHAPKDESLKAFGEFESELKHKVLHLKHTYLKHEPEYFAAVQHLSDADLTSFTSSDFESVRVAVSAYGIIMFGKLRIPAMPDSGPAYIHFRAFTAGPDETASLHSIHTEEREEPNGGKKYRAIFTKDDALEWFDT
ncbi:Uu.00g015890.m01.CDS01 [Anthostomella pinea]|uniref:Uu.00g015890.m01.CDS01 n=1 Tax=Anthostomella pinea TaxID=933095 RepID=A0AAI8VZI0_9PEZI|nr:Uu.00g015890.m01.CDS01 [Anthostomella pinea]